MLGCVAGVTKRGKGAGPRRARKRHRPGWRGARECDMCCGDRTAVRAYVVRASESLQHVPQQPCFPSHTSSQNHPLPPLSPFPFACMRFAFLCLVIWFCPQTAAPCALRANPSAGAVMPALVDRRSTVAAKPPTPERRCDAANRPADARPGRPRAHRCAP